MEGQTNGVAINVTGGDTGTTAATTGGGGSYHHIQLGTAYKMYYWSIGIVVLVMIYHVSLLIYFGAQWYFIIPWAAYILLIGIMFYYLAKAFKHLEFRDEGNQIVIEFGPSHPCCLCGVERNTLLYSDIRVISEMEPTIFMYCINFS